MLETEKARAAEMAKGDQAEQAEQLEGVEKIDLAKELEQVKKKKHGDGEMSNEEKEKLAKVEAEKRQLEEELAELKRKMLLSEIKKKKREEDRNKKDKKDKREKKRSETETDRKHRLHKSEKSRSSKDVLADGSKDRERSQTVTSPRGERKKDAASSSSPALLQPEKSKTLREKSSSSSSSSSSKSRHESSERFQKEKSRSSNNLLRDSKTLGSKPKDKLDSDIQQILQDEQLDLVEDIFVKHTLSEENKERKKEHRKESKEKDKDKRKEKERKDREEKHRSKERTEEPKERTDDAKETPTAQSPPKQTWEDRRNSVSIRPKNPASFHDRSFLGAQRVRPSSQIFANNKTTENSPLTSSPRRPISVPNFKSVVRQQQQDIDTDNEQDKANDVEQPTKEEQEKLDEIRKLVEASLADVEDSLKHVAVELQKVFQMEYITGLVLIARVVKLVKKVCM